MGDVYGDYIIFLEDLFEDSQDVLGNTIEKFGREVKEVMVKNNIPFSDLEDVQIIFRNVNQEEIDHYIKEGIPLKSKKPYKTIGWKIKLKGD